MGTHPRAPLLIQGPAMPPPGPPQHIQMQSHNGNHLGAAGSFGGGGAPFIGYGSVAAGGSNSPFGNTGAGTGPKYSLPVGAGRVEKRVGGSTAGDQRGEDENRHGRGRSGRAGGQSKRRQQGKGVRRVGSPGPANSGG